MKESSQHANASTRLGEAWEAIQQDQVEETKWLARQEGLDNVLARLMAEREQLVIHTSKDPAEVVQNTLSTLTASFPHPFRERQSGALQQVNTLLAQIFADAKEYAVAHSPATGGDGPPMEVGLVAVVHGSL